MTYLTWSHSSTRTPALRVINFTILVDPSLVIITKNILFLPNNYISPEVGRGVIKFIISCLLTLQKLQVHIDWSSTLEEDGQRTMHDNRHQPIANSPK